MGDVRSGGRRFNTPRFAGRLAVWTAICLVLLAMCVRLIVTTSWGSGAWQVGVFGVGLAFAAYAFTLAVLFWSQREIEVDDRAITVRRWIQAVRGGSLSVIPLPGLRVGFERGYLICALPGSVVREFVGFWGPEEVKRLSAELAVRGVPVES
jgi:hypothetical protein